jgi:phenylalanine-4-hydroxylase
MGYLDEGETSVVPNTGSVAALQLKPQRESDGYILVVSVTPIINSRSILFTGLKLCRSRTGWKIHPVAGLLHPRDFLNALAFKTFHSTQ